MGRKDIDHVHQYPCLHCHPQSYIRMVQHLIERCLLHKMTSDDCVRALEKHANIKPEVTLTVWGELMKENMEFFHTYYQAMSSRPFTYPRVGTPPYGPLQRFPSSHVQKKKAMAMAVKKEVQ